MSTDISRDQLPSTSTLVASSGSENVPNVRHDETNSNDQQSKTVTQPSRKSKQVCRFYGTKKGCRAGEQCPYKHVAKAEPRLPHTETLQGEDLATTIQSEPIEPSRVQVVNSRQQSNARDRTVVSKPVSSLQQKDPREFQINQLIRRYAPVRGDSHEGTVLKLRIKPSDPDFPFELDTLQCSVSVPVEYPKSGKPSIKVTNTDIPRGFQINIERGFDSLCSRSPTKTILQLLNDLDRNLERFLTSEKVQTIKIVTNRGKEEQPTSTNPPKEAPTSPTPQIANISTPYIPAWTVQQKTDAKVKRENEIRQLEARMNRVSLFSTLPDGISFNVPLQIPKPARLPVSLQPLKDMVLVVPKLYNLEACRIKLKGVSGPEAESVELVFEQRAKEHNEMTLMAHINYLTQNIHQMTTVLSPVVVLNEPPTQPSVEPHKPADKSATGGSNHGIISVVDEDRPHLQFLSQPPPEWSQKVEDEQASETETSDDFDSEDESSDVSEDAQSQAGGASLPVSAASTTMEKGVLLSFPHMELYSIELLELREIALSVKCDRCRDVFDIKNIKPAEPNSNLIRTELCNKCAAPISVSYRSEAMHINSIKAGYLDLEGCTVVDMLPSRFIPTCAECSTTQSQPGVVTVRGETPMSICRECHQRLTFKIPEIKFLRVASNDRRIGLPLKSKKKKENLGITAGTELPDRGRCQHYAKSYRWFRFSCCNRVYPCDRCHDAKEEHLNEHANRMICGWCSREQNYRPEDCHACGRSVIRKTGGGFWEGGKGTRDKTKMSRKDPRKFKRIGGGAKGGEK